MPIVYAITDDLRVRLKQPLGLLITGPFAETMTKLADLVKAEKPSLIVSVGDTVSRNLEKSQFFPKLSIIDNRAMRKDAERFDTTAEETVHIKNPQATITDEAIAAIRKALNSEERVRIVVEGEEDLLTLVVILYAPFNSIVVYGQPYEGVVAVKVTPEKKAEIDRILRTMESAGKAK